MDDAEACFILSNRFEVDRIAAVRSSLPRFITKTFHSVKHLYQVFMRDNNVAKGESESGWMECDWSQTSPCVLPTGHTDITVKKYFI